MFSSMRLWPELQLMNRSSADQQSSGVCVFMRGGVGDLDKTNYIRYVKSEKFKRLCHVN